MEEDIIREFQGKYRWLSNFWFFDGTTVEHLYQAAKAINKKDEEYILSSSNPGVAKRRAKMIHLREEWEDIKVGIMHNLLQRKFKNPILRKNLLATGNKILQEGNRWYDTFWGIDLRTGLGENNLGKLIMQVRDEIRQEGIPKIDKELFKID
jgi:ribA/ribD-fused uncharacterized protein